MQCRQQKSKNDDKHGIIHTEVSCPLRVTSFVLPRETDWNVLWDLVLGMQLLKSFVTHQR